MGTGIFLRIPGAMVCAWEPSSSISSAERRAASVQRSLDLALEDDEIFWPQCNGHEMSRYKFNAMDVK
jgi:hypothetical protein